MRNSNEEMKKFVLLPEDGDHDKPVFRAKSIREWPKRSRRRSTRGSILPGSKSSELSVRNMMQEDPSPTPPQFFLGREVDLYFVLSALLKLNKRYAGETSQNEQMSAQELCVLKLLQGTRVPVPALICAARGQQQPGRALS